MGRFLKTVLGIATLTALTFASSAYAAEERTANRDVKLNVAPYPIVQYGKQAPHLRVRENHPAQWEGISWDTKRLKEMGWSADRALDDLYYGDVIKKTYVKKGKPAVKVGRGYFELSDLDQRRALQLLAEHTEIFDRGHPYFLVYSAKHRRVIGSYSKSGLQLK